MVARDVAFVGDGDGYFLPIFERNRLKRAQYAAFVDSLDCLLHTTTVYRLQFTGYFRRY